MDSFPRVVANRNRRSHVKVARPEGGFKKANTKQVKFFGYRIHLLINLEGVVSNLVMAPANARDSTLAPEVLEGAEVQVALENKVYRGIPLRAELAQYQIQMLALRPEDWQTPSLKS
jgi:IS5 family transposase